MGETISLEEFAMLVECPICGACDVGGDSVEACWRADGSEHEATHPERLAAAVEHLERARAALSEKGERDGE